MKKSKTTVSYVWVNNSAKESESNRIPCEEEGHGLKNIVSNALKTPKSTHILYLDRLTDGQTTFDRGLEIPDNVQFKTLDSLFDEVSSLMKKNKVDNYEKLVVDLQAIYDAEMNHGKPAFAGNVIKLCALYTGGMVCDIGISFREGIIKDYNKKKIYRTGMNHETVFHSVKGSNYTLKSLRSFVKHYTTSADDLLRSANELVEYSSFEAYSELLNQRLSHTKSLVGGVYCSPSDFVKQASEIAKFDSKGTNHMWFKAIYSSSGGGAMLQDIAYSESISFLMPPKKKVKFYKTGIDFLRVNKLSHRPDNSLVTSLSGLTHSSVLPNQTVCLNKTGGVSEISFDYKEHERTKQRKESKKKIPKQSRPKRF